MVAEEKAALLLTSLNPRDAEDILVRLGPEQGSRLRAQIKRIAQLPDAQEQANQILQEFDGFLDQVEAGLTAPSASNAPSPPERLRRPKQAAAPSSDSDQGDAVAQLRHRVPLV